MLKSFPNCVAHTVRVDETGSGLGNFVLPGSEVDLIAVLPGKERGKFTQTFLQKKTIIAVDDKAWRDQDQRTSKPRFVTLAVEPEDARLIAWVDGQGAGSLKFFLRAHGLRIETNPPPIFDLRIKIAPAGPTAPGTVLVAVAKTDVKRDTKIDDPSKFFEMKPCPTELAERMVKDINALKDKTVATELKKDDPIRRSDFHGQFPLDAQVASNTGVLWIIGRTAEAHYFRNGMLTHMAPPEMPAPPKPKPDGTERPAPGTDDNEPG